VPISAEQEAYFTQNTQKNATVMTWLTFTMSHPDWSESVYLVGLVNNQPVEFDLSVYTFEGVLYQPVSMRVDMPSESKQDNGKMSITFPRAGTEVKRRMSEITPANSRVPISFAFKQYQEGTVLPVKTFAGNIAPNYPQISGSAVKIQASSYNPSLLTSQNIATLAKYPELRVS
jgi:hypothetical protein